MGLQASIFNVPEKLVELQFTQIGVFDTNPVHAELVSKSGKNKLEVIVNPAVVDVEKSTTKRPSVTLKSWRRQECAEPWYSNANANAEPLDLSKKKSINTEWVETDFNINLNESEWLSLVRHRDTINKELRKVTTAWPSHWSRTDPSKQPWLQTLDSRRKRQLEKSAAVAVAVEPPPPHLVHTYGRIKVLVGKHKNNGIACVNLSRPRSPLLGDDVYQINLMPHDVRCLFHDTNVAAIKEHMYPPEPRTPSDYTSAPASASRPLLFEYLDETVDSMV